MLCVRLQGCVARMDAGHAPCGRCRKEESPVWYLQDGSQGVAVSARIQGGRLIGHWQLKGALGTRTTPTVTLPASSNPHLPPRYLKDAGQPGPQSSK